MSIPDDMEFSSISNIINASDFLPEDCAAIFELQIWLTAFYGELICLNISKNEKELSN